MTGSSAGTRSSWEDQRFRFALEDERASLYTDLETESRSLLLAFGGVEGKPQRQPFEFFSLTREMPVKRVFVRDLQQAWYHRGVPGRGSSIDEVGESLGRLIAAHEVDRLVVVGASAGGYAALAFGTLLGADRVLCFGPQTSLDLGSLSAMGDHRWDARLKKLRREDALDPWWTDLSRALPRARRAAVTYDLYFDDGFASDRVHAERLAGLDGVRLHRLEMGGHKVARALRATGELETLLRAALGIGSG